MRAAGAEDVFLTSASPHLALAWDRCLSTGVHCLARALVCIVVIDVIFRFAEGRMNRMKRNDTTYLLICICAPHLSAHLSKVFGHRKFS